MSEKGQDLERDDRMGSGVHPEDDHRVRADGGQRAGQGVLRRGVVAADSASTVVRVRRWFTRGRIPYTSRVCERGRL